MVPGATSYAPTSTLVAPHSWYCALLNDLRGTCVCGGGGGGGGESCVCVCVSTAREKERYMFMYKRNAAHSWHFYTCYFSRNNIKKTTMREK